MSARVGTRALAGAFPKGFPIENYYLIIEEMDAVSKYNIPKHSNIKLYKSDQFPLCDNFRRDDFFTYSGSRLYKPVEVILDAR